jgi:hypothetical protein
MPEARLTSSIEELTFMDLAKRDISLDHAGIDHVSRFIRALAVGMIVLGTAFAVLDWCDLLPPLPATADYSHSTHAT